MNEEDTVRLMLVILTVAGAAIRSCGPPALGVDTLDRHVEWVPGVPRLEMGFGVARDMIRVGNPTHRAS
jgi:hypothetical protein